MADCLLLNVLERGMAEALHVHDEVHDDTPSDVGLVDQALDLGVCRLPVLVGLEQHADGVAQFPARTG